MIDRNIELKVGMVLKSTSDRTQEIYQLSTNGKTKFSAMYGDTPSIVYRLIDYTEGSGYTEFTHSDLEWAYKNKELVSIPKESQEEPRVNYNRLRYIV